MRDGTLLPPARLMPPVRPLPAGAAELRSQVRGFLSAERAASRFVPACDAWLSGWDESFSRRLAERGWVGMTIPREYGGHGRSALERYVVVEELLAAGFHVGGAPRATQADAPLDLEAELDVSVSDPTRT